MMMRCQMSIPQLNEIMVYGSLDEQAAAEHFLGKDVAEATALFSENSAYYFEDLMWMGPSAFCYYIAAVFAYLESSASTRDMDGLEALQIALRFRLEQGKDQVAAALPEINSICRYVCEHVSKYCSRDSECRRLRKTYLELEAASDPLRQSP